MVYGFASQAYALDQQPAFSDVSLPSITAMPPSKLSYSSTTTKHSPDAAALPPDSITTMKHRPLHKPDKQDEEDERGYVINFDNVGIIEYIRWISDITHMNFIFNEQDLQFNITIISKGPASTEAIMATLLQMLHIHGLAMLEQGNNILIYKSSDSPTTSHIITDTDAPIPSDSAIITKVFQLKNVNPTRVSGIITPLLSKNAQTEVSTETRHLIITDIAPNINKVEELLKVLDQPNVSLDVGIYQVQQSNITTLQSLAERIVGPLAAENPLILVPQLATETIFIISTPYLIEKTISILKTLDVSQEEEEEERLAEDLPPGHIDRTKFQVHKLQYHQGDEIQTSLIKIGRTLAKTGIMNAGLVSTISTIEWIESTNSLVFTGPHEAILKIEELINSLDTPKREVYIEMLIIETSVGNSLTFSVESGFSDHMSKGAASIGMQASKGLQSAIETAAPGGTPSADNLMSAKGFSVGIIGRILSHGNNQYASLGALVNALSTDTDTNIVMNPQIVTENGSPAELFVGHTDQFPSSEISPGQGTYVKTNYEYRRIGARLRVTPTLGNSDIVTLDIDQELSSSADTSDSTSTQGVKTVFATRTTRTRVHVPNKYFLIISGMISESITRTKTRIPCLGTLPVIGAAAGGYTNDHKRSNLMIFIRPHIVTTDEEVAEVTQIQKERLADAMEHDVQFETDSLLDLLQLKDEF